MLDQHNFYLLSLSILINSLLETYGFNMEKLDVSHLWELKF